MKAPLLPPFLLAAILAALSLPQAHAEAPIHFQAEVADEALAEDAILLAHCLSSRTGHSWELAGEARGPYSLRVTENGAKLKAVYQGGAQETTTSFGAGESNEACDTLEPERDAAAHAEKPAEGRPLAALAPPASPAAAAITTMPPGELLAAAEEGPRLSKTALWIGAGVAAVAGGYLILHARSHRPDYGSVQMN